MAILNSSTCTRKSQYHTTIDRKNVLHFINTTKCAVYLTLWETNQLDKSSSSKLTIPYAGILSKLPEILWNHNDRSLPEILVAFNKLYHCGLDAKEIKIVPFTFNRVSTINFYCSSIGDECG